MATTPSSVLGTQSVTLGWNPATNANVAGYNIYYGSASGNYTNLTFVGNVTNATIAGLAQGATYYFAATTLGTSGLESGYSSEVSYTVPSTVPVLQVTPGSIGYGTLLVGTSETNSFTVQNAGSGTLSGSASVSGPFSVVSGGSYSLG
ncbi:MAG TPA: fibronectin type III domain-containing protein, partial [Candidatus Sulfopaludibacter sp.]|nr:fibronectin type III domain-containing protein [Candidatus Sulfopaludibacter sp.]